MNFINKKAAAAAGLGALAMAFTAAATAPAQAQNAHIGAPVAAPWTHFYAGAQGGALVERHQASTPNGEVLGTMQNIAAHGTAGGHTGYRLQMGNFVAGVEGSFSGVLGGKGISSGQKTIKPGVYASSASNPKWTAEAVGTVGVTMGNTLLYAKGGASWLKTDHTGNIQNSAGVISGSETLSATRTGWVAGAGLAYKFTNSNIIAGIEATYSDYGTRKDTFNVPGSTGPVVVDTRTNAARVEGRLSYGF